MLNAKGVLWIVGGILGNGGTESFLMNYYRNMDNTKFFIDFVVHGYGKGVFDDEILSNGSKIYNIPVKSKDYIGNKNKLTEIFKSGKYSIVHAHMNAMNTPVLKLGYKCNIPCRISHAHSTDHQIFDKNIFGYSKRLAGELARSKSIDYATNMFACSEMAAKWLFGDYQVDIGNVKILPNAIDVDAFKFVEANRDIMRKKLGLENCFVVGNVGRFDPSKNQMFLIEIFEKICETKPNARLLLVGDGYTLDQCRQLGISKGIEDKIIFTGAKKDLPKYLHTMDVFVLPSKFEGLGISLIEAQAAGLPCIASSEVPKQADVTGNVKFIPLRSTKRIWMDSILNATPIHYKDHSNELVKKNGYDISVQAKWLENFYIQQCLEKSEIQTTDLVL